MAASKHGASATAPRQATIMLNGTPAQVVLMTYASRFYVIVTQLSKLGTTISAVKDKGIGADRDTYTVKTLIGKRDDLLLTAIARALVERISKRSEKSLLLSIALSPECAAAPGSTLRNIVDGVERLIFGTTAALPPQPPQASREAEGAAAGAGLVR